MIRVTAFVAAVLVLSAPALSLAGEVAVCPDHGRNVRHEHGPVKVNFDLTPTPQDIADHMSGGGSGAIPGAGNLPTSTRDKVVQHAIEITGAIPRDMDVEVELHYSSHEAVHAVARGRADSVDDYNTVAATVNYTDDGKYAVAFNTFRKTWFGMGGGQQLERAVFRVHKDGVQAAEWTVRAAKEVVPMEQVKRIAVRSTGRKLTATVETFQGDAPRGELGLPRHCGEIWIDMPIEVVP